MECCAVQCHAMKQTAQISTHDLAFNDIRKTSCCLQSSNNSNKLTDITKHTHAVVLLSLSGSSYADIHFTMLYICACICSMADLHFCRMHWAIWLCIRHKYVQWPQQHKSRSLRLRLALDCSVFGCKHLARLLLMSFVRVKQRMYSMYFIYFTFISPKKYVRIPRKRVRRLFGYAVTLSICEFA